MICIPLSRPSGKKGNSTRILKPQTSNNCHVTYSSCPFLETNYRLMNIPALVLHTIPLYHPTPLIYRSTPWLLHLLFYSHSRFRSLCLYLPSETTKFRARPVTAPFFQQKHNPHLRFSIDSYTTFALFTWSSLRPYGQCILTQNIRKICGLNAYRNVKLISRK
jgi:hypothetical protein